MNHQNRIATSERSAAKATGGGNIYVSFFVDVLFFSVLCLLCLCSHLFICALWSPAGKGLIPWL